MTNSEHVSSHFTRWLVLNVIALIVIDWIGVFLLIEAVFGEWDIKHDLWMTSLLITIVMSLTISAIRASEKGVHSKTTRAFLLAAIVVLFYALPGWLWFVDAKSASVTYVGYFNLLYWIAIAPFTGFIVLSVIIRLLWKQKGLDKFLDITDKVVGTTDRFFGKFFGTFTWITQPGIRALYLAVFISFTLSYWILPSNLFADIFGYLMTTVISITITAIALWHTKTDLRSLLTEPDLDHPGESKNKLDTINKILQKGFADLRADIQYGGTRKIGIVVLTSLESGTIRVVWQKPIEEPQDYHLTWAKTGKEFPRWYDATGNAHPTGTSYDITGLYECEAYKVKVRAIYDDDMQGTWSDESTITVAGSG